MLIAPLKVSARNAIHFNLQQRHYTYRDNDCQ